jgi:GNAT superfamily N-acetyltransferase
MEIRPIIDGPEMSTAAEIAADRHTELREELSFLPARDANRFLPRIEWVKAHGRIMGAFEDGRLVAFLGAFFLDDFRNAGPGAYSPDWCHGVLPRKERNGTMWASDSFRTCRDLYRALAPCLIENGARIHSVSVYASEPIPLEAFSLTGFGRIVMDAARPTGELLLELEGSEPESVKGLRIRVAEPSDAEALELMNGLLARHIGASPVLVPNTRGGDAARWREWMSESDAIAFIAELDGKPVAYIKAQEPQFDVTFSVHEKTILGINGLYVDESSRGRGLGDALLSRLARHASENGKTIVSVDCETTNLEAFAFWTRRFRPISWSLERRV